MKKLLSGLMVGIIASTCAMTTMAAPSFDHRDPPKPHKVDKKPMPPKAGFHKYNHHDQRNNQHFKNQKDHKGFLNANDRHDKNGPHHKMPPMPPKHR